MDSDFPCYCGLWIFYYSCYCYCKFNKEIFIEGERENWFIKGRFGNEGIGDVLIGDANEMHYLCKLRIEFYYWD